MLLDWIFDTNWNVNEGRGNGITEPKSRASGSLNTTPHEKSSDLTSATNGTAAVRVREMY